MILFVRYLILLTIFLVPLVSSFYNFGYEQAKVVLFTYLVDFSVLIYLIHLVKNRQKIKFQVNKIQIFGFIFIAALFIVSLLSINPAASFFGVYPYYQNFLLYLHLFIFFLLVRSIKIPLKQISISLIATSL